MPFKRERQSAARSSALDFLVIECGERRVHDAKERLFAVKPWRLQRSRRCYAMPFKRERQSAARSSALDFS